MSMLPQPARVRLPEQGYTLGESLRAAGAEAFASSPGPALVRERELSTALDFGNPLTAEIARARLKSAGLEKDLTVPDQGITEEALAILMRRKREEKKRLEVIAGGPQGAGATAARLGAAFGYSLMDPVNIATAFVPVVGPAKYSAMLARAGKLATPAGRFAARAGVRAGVGGVEGLAGAALVEPLILSSKELEQADYSMADSIANVAFGTVFGGGLHVTGGVVVDAFRGGRLAPDVPLTGPAYGSIGKVKIGEQYVDARWALVDAAEVEAALSKAENQARDRTRAASSLQVQEIARNLDFNLLADSPVMDFGVPTLAADGRVIGGNGRIAAIGQAYERGTAGPYVSNLRAALPRYGIDPGRAAGMKKPALVRVLKGEVDVRQAALASNEGGSARMSALEQATVDAERLPDLRVLDVGEAGQIADAGNRAFIRKWVGEFPKTQQPALLDADGRLSAEGLTRLRNAILLKAYGDSPTLRRLVEATDPGSRNVASALTRAAPRFGEARDAIKAGDLHPYDLSADVQGAVEKLALLRAKDMTVADYLAQGDLVGDALSPEARAILAFLDRHIRSPRAMAELMTGFYDAVQQLGSPKQGSLLSGPLPTKMELLLSASQKAEAAPDSAADVLARVSPETRTAALKTAVAQAASGRQVDVEAVVRMDPKADAPAPAETAAYGGVIPKAEDLLPADREIEAKMANRILADVDGAIREYEALKDAEGGKVLNTDTARELSPEYRADRTRSAAVHEPASWLVKEMYRRKLAQAPAEGEQAKVLFTAGGTGAGKTSGIASVAAMKRIKGAAQIVYDTNMNGLKSAVDKIEAALKAGKAVDIIHVIRDPVEALVNGALPRAMRMGRTVPLIEHARTHTGSAEVIQQLMERYANNERVAIAFLDNRHGKSGARVGDVATLREVGYDGLEARLRAVLEKEHAEGRISAEVYRGTLGHDGPGGRGGGDRQDVAAAVQRGLGRTGEAGPEVRGQGDGRLDGQGDRRLEAVRAAASRQLSPESDLTGDFIFAREAQARLAELPSKPSQALEEAEAALTEALSTLKGRLGEGAEERLAKDLKVFDEGIEMAKAAERALKAAALCTGRL